MEELLALIKDFFSECSTKELYWETHTGMLLHSQTELES